MTALRPPLGAGLAALIGLAAAAPPGELDFEPSESPPAVVINEIDADQRGVDSQEFVELHADGVADLSHLFLVLYNGAAQGDRSYDVVDLYGSSTNEQGLFVVGSPEVRSADLVAFSVNGLQNGLDAVALWYGPGLGAADFQGTAAARPPDGAALVDAIVYGRADEVDVELLEALAPVATVVDEGAAGHPGEHSLQRLPDGGAAFASDAYVPTEPTPGALNGRPVLATIHDIQGAGHVSPIEGSYVEGVVGVVTSVGSDRFTLQSVPGTEDDDDATSEALEVFVGRGHRPLVGDKLSVSGVIEEHRPGGVEQNLSTTRLRVVGDWELLAAGQALPAPVVLGVSGRLPPDRIVDDDTSGQVGPDSGVFDPVRDGLDFYESLESMRVQVRSARAVGPTSKYGEIPVVGDRGRHASTLGRRGALVRTRGDDQPERILVDDAQVPTPSVNLGDAFDGPLTGVMGYSFGNYKLVLTEPVRGLPQGPAPESLPPADPAQLRVASFNVQNLAATSRPRRVRALARHVVEGLGAPDVVALQEVQDDSGPFDDGVVSADGTLDLLIDTIAQVGGPTYEAWDLDPEDGADGGQSGGNIRVAWLVRTDRDVTVVHRAGGTATTPTVVRQDGRGRPYLEPSPGRVAPGHGAWERSRKPLALELQWKGRSWFLVNVHLVSKGADTPLFGSFQPPVLASEVKRAAQTGVLAGFVKELLAADPDALVIVLGDFNDFADSTPLANLGTDRLLQNLTERLPFDDRYTYVYQGRAQVLDHVFVSPGLVESASTLAVDVCHRVAERHDGASDHDPVVLTVGWHRDGRTAPFEGLR